MPVCANTNSDVGFKSLLPSSQEWSQNCKQTSKVGLAVSSALSVSAAPVEMSHMKTTDWGSDVTAVLLCSPSYTFALIQCL